MLAFILAHQYMKGITRHDVIYCAATVSHGEGFMVGCFVQWALGACVCLENTFDPGRFFQTCKENGVTLLSYVGMMPRLLLQSAPGPCDQDHAIRVASGHEMLATTWEDFQERFRIPRIVEYFAATEGTYFFTNDDQPGAVGFAGPLTTWLLPFVLLKIDDDNELIREGGKPVPCKRGEVGELFAPINPADPLTLSVYADPSLDQENKYRSLFRPGDYWCRSGDIMRHDPSGYLYFMGKRKTSFRVRGDYVNPQFVEDKIQRAAGSKTLPVEDCLAFFVHQDAGRVPAVSLYLQGPFKAEKCYAYFRDILTSSEMPEFVIL